MLNIEIRSDKVIIDGYVNAVGRDSRPISTQTGKFVEQVEPGVFRAALKRVNSVDLLLNHRRDRKLGSTGSGELTLSEDTIGLRAHAEITDAEAVKKARAEKLRGWSFGMHVNESTLEERSGGIPRRHLTDIDLYEVSLIDDTMLPCYAGTSVECRAEGDRLTEIRAFDDEIRTVHADPYDLSEFEQRSARLKAEAQLTDLEKRAARLRYASCAAFSFNGYG